MPDKPNTPLDRADGLDAAIDPELLARAEQAVAAMREDFSAAILTDIAELRDLIDRLAAAPDDASIPDRIFSIAHDLHGQGGSFGYPLISRVGAALCRYIERHGDASRGDSLRNFADAAAAIVAENVTGEGDAVSRATVGTLEALVDNAVQSNDRRA